MDGITGQTLTYRELDQITDTMAWQLSDLGVRPGDVVAYLSQNRIGIVSLIFALGKLGAAWTPLNPQAQLREWVRQLEHSQALFVISDMAHVEESVKEEQVAAGSKSLTWVNLNELSLSSPYRPPFPIRSKSGDKAALIYTSGTTDSPKGVWHTHQTLWEWNFTLLVSLGIDQDDCLINPYPLFHMGGVGFSLATIQAGATLLLETPFEAEHFVDSVKRYGATITLMVPTMVQSLLDLNAVKPVELQNSSLRELITTSAPLMTSTRHEMEKTWPNLSLSVLYSATEAIFSLLRREKPKAGLCVGRPVWGTEITILDQNKKAVPPGQAGTIYVQGYGVFPGYHLSPDQFGSWHQNWFTCHDIGYQDNEGYLYLVDREKDLINSGGEKISSLEIENVLRSHPDIREAAVIGVPDRYWGESIHALVVRINRSLSAEEVRQFARNLLPPFKVPKSITFIQELPKTGTGKLKKSALRQFLRQDVIWNVSKIPTTSEADPFSP